MYISSCSHYKERCFKVAQCIYHHVFITRKDVLKLCSVYIYQVFITRKVVLKLRNVYIILCSLQGKLFQSYVMYISSCADHKERCFKVAQCIYHHVLITRKDVLKLGNVYIIKC